MQLHLRHGMADNRRICVVTGSRSEYGLIYWLLRELADDPELDLQLVVTGTHLEDRFGHTVDAIVADGFPISARVPMNLTDDTPETIARAMAQCLIGMTEAFATLDPDLLVLLGDRFEILAAAEAAMLSRIPIAHIHGGEATEGLIDESIRHAVTKMAHLHFAATAVYADRIVQMGEDRARVFTVGAPGLDHISRRPLLDRPALEAQLGITLTEPTFLVTYHPVTLSGGDQATPVREMLAAIDRFPEAMVVVTGANADPGNSPITRELTAYGDSHPDRLLLVPSLGQERYLSLLKLCDVVIGNSSSGIIEAPAVGTPTVNIGPRQRGRLKAASIIDCAANRDDIERAIRQALAPGFVANDSDLPYGVGGASAAIKDVIKSVDLDGILIKTFRQRRTAA